MASLPLAYPRDLAAWLGQSIEESDARAGAVLSAASALVRSYTGETWLDADGNQVDVPDDVKAVVVQVAARVWMNPSALESISVDDTTRRWGSSGVAGMFLSDADKEVLAAYVTTASPNIGSIGISVNGGVCDTLYVPTGPPPSGYPFPWYDGDETWP